VLLALEEGLGLRRADLALSWATLERVGNCSSASVLMILRATQRRPPVAGTFGVLLAMGPGFCSELVLLRW